MISRSPVSLSQVGQLSLMIGKYILALTLMRELGTSCETRLKQAWTGVASLHD
jgi:hypothetical protein